MLLSVEGLDADETADVRATVDYLVKIQGRACNGQN